MKRSDTSKQANEQEQQEITFPYEYTRPRCSVSFKIYKTPREDYDAFTLVYYQEGLRKRVLKSTFEAAVAEADEVAKLLGSKDVDVLELKSADRAAYKRAREVLDPVGISIEVAAVEYAHIKRILGDTPPTVAAEYYVRKHPTKIEAKTVPVVVKEFLEAKEADGCSRRYRLAAVQNTAQVALEAGNSPQMIFRHYRELVRPADAEKWFAVTPASVEADKTARQAGAEGKIVALPKVAAA